MWKNRAGYALAVAALAALVWLFGRPFLVCALVLAAGLPFVQLALLKRDAGAVSVSLSVRPGGREGEALLLCFEVENGRALHAARSIYLDLAMNNLLLGEETHRRVMLTQRRRKPFFLPDRAALLRRNRDFLPRDRSL